MPDDPQNPSTPPTPPPIAPPSATVEPFDAVGQPPAAAPAPKKSPVKGIILVLLLLILLGGGGYYAYASGMLASFGLGAKKAATTTTPTPKPAASADTALETSLQDVDTGMGDLSNNLTNVDSALSDKQGDVSE